MSDQLGCLDFRMESKLSLLAEFQEFFKKRGEVEYEYARSLERLCEKFERNTKQRNIRSGSFSPTHQWRPFVLNVSVKERGEVYLQPVVHSAGRD